MDKDYFFMERIKFDALFDEIKSKKNYSWPWKACLSFDTGLIMAYISTKEYKDLLGINGEDVEKLIIFGIAVSSLYLLISLIHNLYYIVKKKTKKIDLHDIKEELIKKSQDIEVNTLILIVPNYTNGSFKFLAKRKESWGNTLLLPYTEYKNDIDIEDQEESIISNIRKEYNINIWLKLEFIHSMDQYEIKYTKEQNLKKVYYKFALCLPSSAFLWKKLEDQFLEIGYSFYSIHDMENDYITVRRNYDVISKLKEHTTEINDIVDKLKVKETRIIWNIEKACNKGCVFCAYGEKQEVEEIKLEDIEKIIDNISKIKVKEIDIATGDQVNVEKLKLAIALLNKKRINVSLTTTADVIESVTIDYLKGKVKKVELTYDSTIEYSFRSKNYNVNNFKMAEKLRLNGIHVQALVILYIHLSIGDFNKIIKSLKGIGISNIQLIRLMPVGNVSWDKYPESLKSKKFYDEYYNIAKKNNIDLHCSLEGLNDEKYICTKYYSKLGLSQNGDLYSCAWAEHLNLAKNNFYIGNALRDSLVEILNKSIKRSNSQYFECEIFKLVNPDSVDVLYE